jgi:hypothetical protein
MYACALARSRPHGAAWNSCAASKGARAQTYQLLAQAVRGELDGAATTTPKTGIRPTCPTAACRQPRPCLYGVTEAAVLAAGYAPGSGLHPHGQAAVLRLRRGRCLQVRDGGARWPSRWPPASRRATPERAVRLACRDIFRQTGCWSGSSPTSKPCWPPARSPPRPPADARWGRRCPTREHRRCWSSCLRTRHPAARPAGRVAAGSARRRLRGQLLRKVREHIWAQVEDGHRGRQCGDGLAQQQPKPASNSRPWAPTAACRWTLTACSW